MRLKNRRNKTGRKQKHSYIYILFSYFLWSGVIAVGLWLILFISTGERFAIVRLLSYIAPWLMMLIFSIAVTALLMKKKRLAILSCILSLIISLPYLHMIVPFNKVADKSKQQTYKIMTYSKMGRNHNIEAVANVIKKEKPDILFMQEISEIDANDLIKKLMSIYEGELSFFMGKGLTLSRFKVEPAIIKDRDVWSTTIKLPESDISAWNVHLPKSFFNTDIQYKHVKHLAEHVSKEQLPIIVAGDFNATVLNYPYVKIKQYLNNAFEKVGFGFGFTFPSPARNLGWVIPFMRIDHIFFSNHFEITSAYVVSDAGKSDHYPVVAYLALKESIKLSDKSHIMFTQTR